MAVVEAAKTLLLISQMPQQQLLRATRFLQRIGEDRHSVKGTVIVDALSDGQDGRIENRLTAVANADRFPSK